MPDDNFCRLASIEDGCDELPCSIVMTEQLEGSECLRVIGHARLMPVAGRNDAALIETGILDIYSWKFFTCAACCPCLHILFSILDFYLYNNTNHAFSCTHTCAHPSRYMNKQ